ncbi:MAG: ESCRT-III subunit protein snf7 [Trizodia sp. TS-e1964]|nr:MAG: ESCRT-III subunit protein snf7 [Trizodia sp. TS-e1964]
MSGIWGYFGGNSAQKRKDMPKNAILNLREQLEMLQKRERHLENQINEQEAVARKNISTNKEAARAALKRKKRHELSLEQTMAQIMTVEVQINSIESANINQETLIAMKKAGEAMKQIHAGMTVDKVDETMEALREQEAVAKEISIAISSPFGETVDDDEIEEQLESLKQEQLDVAMLGTGTIPVSDKVQTMPNVGSGPLKASSYQTAEDDEEEELRRLQAEMAV